TASTDETAAAERPNTSVFWSAVPFGPLKMYSKLANVGVALPGNATVSAETSSDPYTSVIIPASARQAAKQAHDTRAGTGGRGIDEARPLTVTNERGPSRRTFAKYSSSASASRIVLTAAAPGRSPKPLMRPYACVGRTVNVPPMSAGLPKSSST